MTWRMPSETANQDRIWMAFPPEGYTLGDSAEDAHEARSTWSAVANAIVEFEPVTMVVDPADVAIAHEYLASEVEVLEAPLDDAWMRDIGPTFVIGEDGTLGGVDWVFNGWGQQSWARWERDSQIARQIIAASGATLVSSALVNEGGGIHVDGNGTVLVTETVQRDPGRNPGISRGQIEGELLRTIGAQHAIWLPRGLTRDSERFGTRGHVDIVATIPSPALVLVHAQLDASHPDFAVSREVIELLEASVDAAGDPFTVIPVPAPDTLTDAEGWVDYSYINHLVINDAVIACVFGDAGDNRAIRILEAAYPGRTIVPIDARPIFARGGGIHCITQQQPSVRGA